MLAENFISGVSKSSAKSKMEIFVTKVNGMLPAIKFCHKVLHLTFCTSPRYTSVKYEQYA